MNFNKQLWVSFTIIAASIAIAVAGMSYFSSALDASAVKLVNDRTSLQAETDAVDTLAQLEHDAPIAAQYQSAINKLLPTQDQLIGFGDLLNAVAASDTVTATFAFQGNPAIPQPGTAGTAAFSLDVVGAPDRIALFLRDIESNSTNFLLTITSFNLTNDGSGNGNLTAQGSLFFQ